MVTLETEIIGFFLFYKSNTLKRCEWTVVRWCGVSQDHTANTRVTKANRRPTIGRKPRARRLILKVLWRVRVKRSLLSALAQFYMVCGIDAATVFARRR